MNELHTYVEKSYKELKEHGFFYYLEKDTNVLFNYRKEQYQEEKQTGLELGLRTLFDYGGQIYENVDILLNEEDLLGCDLEALQFRVYNAIEQHLKIPCAKIPKTGEYTIILQHKPASVFVHEAVGHLFEEDNYLQQTIFNEKTMINPSITVTDYAHAAFDKTCLLPVFVDSEGSEANDVVLIGDGRIQNRMTNRQFGVTKDCTGNARSSLFLQPPQIRMRNTALEVDASLISHLSAFDHAIVVEKVNCGSSENNGEVELFVEFGHEMKGGTITGYVRDFVRQYTDTLTVAVFD